ncbi:hypothetical protein [Amycolatopsis sp. NPDC001319]|uniref:hypothetical protein n=1 Tax=unclassified Amycolatopsis TaxID=2618356 RepID=UPI003691C6B7
MSVEGSHPFVVESMAGAEPDGRSPPSARRADPDRDGCHRTIFLAHHRKSAVSPMVRARAGERLIVAIFATDRRAVVVVLGGRR